MSSSTMPASTASSPRVPGVGSFAAAIVPPLVLAGIGLVHPHQLTDATAAQWQTLHIVLLPLFPLLAFGPWVLARATRPRWAPVAAVLGGVYAVCYTVLDTLAGIGAGGLQLAGAAEHKGVLYSLADAIVLPGVLALLVATVLAVAATVGSSGWAALPGGLLVVGAAVSYIDSHLYWPRGVLTMVAFALGWALLLVAVRRARRGAS